MAHERTRVVRLVLHVVGARALVVRRRIPPRFDLRAERQPSQVDRLATLFMVVGPLGATAHDSQPRVVWLPTLLSIAAKDSAATRVSIFNVAIGLACEAGRVLLLRVGLLCAATANIPTVLACVVLGQTAHLLAALGDVAAVVATADHVCVRYRAESRRVGLVAHRRSVVDFSDSDRVRWPPSGSQG